MRLLLTVVRSEGVTALVATHDEALIDLADEVLRLEDGHLVTDRVGALGPRAQARTGGAGLAFTLNVRRKRADHPARRTFGVRSRRRS